MKEIDLGHNLIEHYSKPINGRLFVVGDLHGCYTLLMNKLKNKIQFSAGFISICWRFSRPRQ